MIVKRILLAALLSAILMFLWGFLFWGIMDFSSKLMQPLPAELGVLAALRGSQATSGMYIYPAPPGSQDQAAREEFEAKHEEGPILQMAYRADGGPMMPPAKFVQGLVHYFVISLLTAALVALAGRGLPKFGQRFLVVFLVSLIATLWSNGCDMIWWFHFWGYCLGNTAYYLVSGFLMAFVVASLVKCSVCQAEAGEAG